MNFAIMMPVWIVLGAALTVATLPGTLELFILTIGAVLPKRRPRVWSPRVLGPRVLSPRVSSKLSKTSGKTRLIAVVPAHNEELHIERCVTSILRSDRTGIDLDVVVIADNCTDRTAELANRSGAGVLARTDTLQRGKGYALHYAFEMLLPEGPDAFIVVDADSEVSKDFLVEIASLIRAGADAVQARYLLRSGDDSARGRLMRFAAFAFNVLRPRGRDRLGLSAGIYGNGFAISAETVRQVPYSLASSVVEDLEYHLALVRAGRRVRFAEQAAVYADIPTSVAGLKTQRARWEGGRFHMLGAKLVPLLKEIIQGNLAAFEPLLDLLLLPIAFHVVLLVLALGIPLRSVRGLAEMGLAMVFLHFALAFQVSRSTTRDFAALISAPLYILWKILMLPRLMRNTRTGTAWVRTERVGEHHVK